MNLSEEKQREYAIQTIKETLASTEKPSVKIGLDLSHKPTIFESKFSGTGYLPYGAEIPVDAKKRQLRLLAQLECDKISLENFPKTGL